MTCYDIPEKDLIRNAAPDLLEALQEILKAYRLARKQIFGTDSIEEQARAAITKATKENVNLEKKINSKHTYGPWGFNDNNGKIYELSTQKEICSIPSDDDEDMRNAQLIETAPELLESLDDLLILCETECDGVWHGDGAWEEAKNAHDVIVKATKENF